MTTEITNSDHVLKQKYFLVSKRGTIIFILLGLLAYGAAVLRNEFIWSVSGPSNEYDVAIGKLGCLPYKTTLGQPSYFKNNGELLKPRSVLLLDRDRVYGRYLDDLNDNTRMACFIANIYSQANDGRNLVLYFYDRKTDKAIAKITMQSAR